MTRLLDKYQGILERRARMLAVGSDAVGLVNQQMLSPTRAIIDGRETLLAGTNNYMGITFEPDCIAAGQAALAAFGTGTTGSRIANGTYALHTELERRSPTSSGASTASSSPPATRPTWR
jgi:8-amino-7-oxononanoate synthase